MSSSNRPPGKSDAAVYRGTQPVGPLRLPRKEKHDFIVEFNRIYGDAGLKIDSEDCDRLQDREEI
ncbi:MAG: hypothetical protein AAFX06_31825 [Planctomycetota bacterium]